MRAPSWTCTVEATQLREETFFVDAIGPDCWTLYRRAAVVEFGRYGVAANVCNAGGNDEHSRSRDSLCWSRKEKMGAELGGDVLLRLLHRVDNLVAVGLQHVLRQRLAAIRRQSILRLPQSRHRRGNRNR